MSETRDARIEAAARALSEHWRDVHTNEALGRQRMLAGHALAAADAVSDGDDEDEPGCCMFGCNGGGCESCPCCRAGWCVSGRHGIPERGRDREHWLAVVEEVNPALAQSVRALVAGAGEHAHIRAEALRDAAAELVRDGDEVPYRRAYNSIYAAWLTERAGRIEEPA